MPLAPVRIALEATGGYEQGVLGALYAASLPVVRVNPRRRRRPRQPFDQTVALTGLVSYLARVGLVECRQTRLGVR